MFNLVLRYANLSWFYFLFHSFLWHHHHSHCDITSPLWHHHSHCDITIVTSPLWLHHCHIIICCKTIVCQTVHNTITQCNHTIQSQYKPYNHSSMYCAYSEKNWVKLHPDLDLMTSIQYLHMPKHQFQGQGTCLNDTSSVSLATPWLMLSYCL